MAAAEQLSDLAAALAELASAASRIKVTVSAQHSRQFERYISTLLWWRERVSLITAATPLAIVRFHIVDALAVAPFVEPGARVADLGSGAGFPGIPLAIVRPDATFVLVESRRKKANFLREALRRADIANADVAESRAESVAGEFDMVVSRAVWPLQHFLDVAERLLRPEGTAIAMKGPAALQQEVVGGVGFPKAEIVRYQLHGGIQRLLFVFRRRSGSPRFT